MMVLEDFRPSYILEAVWAEYVQHMMSERFVWRLHSGVENRNDCVYGYVTMHTNNSVPFISHTKRMVRFFINYINFLFNIFN
jgi:hypothetical protein